LASFCVPATMYQQIECFYLSLVRSQLLYCSQVWRPSLVKEVKIIEDVQRCATKFILNDFTSDYRTRLLIKVSYPTTLNAVWTKRHLFLCQISNKHPGPSTSQIMSHSVATTLDLVHTTNWYNLFHQPIISTLVDYPAYGTLYHPLIYLQVMELSSIESRTSSGNTSSQTLTHSTLVPITSVVHAPNVRFSPNRSSSPSPMLHNHYSSVCDHCTPSAI